MFNTTAANIAAQKQRGMFDEPAPAEAFTLASPEADPAILAATKHGATFDTVPTGHRALAHRRGRPVALATFVAGTKAEAAAMFCRYFHIKV